MAKLSFGNVDCSYTLHGKRMYPPSDEELRLIIKACKDACPPATRLASLSIEFDQACSRTRARFEGTLELCAPRHDAPVRKPERYTLYEAAEIARMRERARFYDTWHPCETCNRNPRQHPTARIEGAWTCFECNERAFEKPVSKDME